MKSWLTNLFKKPDRVLSLQEFNNSTRKKNQTLRTYALRMQLAAQKAFPDVEPDGSPDFRNIAKREIFTVKTGPFNKNTKYENKTNEIPMYAFIRDNAP